MPYFQKAQGRGNCGFFETLPIELLHYIFDYLPLTEIGQLALASDALRVKVANWIWTTKCQNRAVFKFSQLFTNEFDVLTIPATQLGRTEILSLYLSSQSKLDEYGVLCKRLTCLSHTTDRLKFAFTAFKYCLHRHEGKIKKLLEDEKLDEISEEWSGCIHLLQVHMSIRFLTASIARAVLGITLRAP